VRVPAGAVVVGVGLSSSASAGEVRELVERALAAVGLPWAALHAVATLDTKVDDVRLSALDLPVIGFTAAELLTVGGVAASDRVRNEVGTASVAEAAALLAAGDGAVLVSAKRRSAHVTVALARA
jgi:cobalamin biosynthesis protein CbiG